MNIQETDRRAAKKSVKTSGSPPEKRTRLSHADTASESISRVSLKSSSTKHTFVAESRLYLTQWKQFESHLIERDAARNIFRRFLREKMRQ